MSTTSEHLVPRSTGRQAVFGADLRKLRMGVLEVLSAVSIVAGLSITSATILGAAWMAVGWMRFYGIEVGVLPQALPVAPCDYNNELLSLIGRALDCYNCTFQGNSRFGSGLGVIAGASIALLLIPADNRAGRATGALVAGALVGGRISLTFTSDPAPFLFGSLATALVFLIVEYLTRQQLPALPGIHYWKTTSPYSPSARKPPSTEMV